VSAFWNNLFYLWAGNDHLRAYSFNGSKLSTTEQSSNSINQIQHAGSLSVSANGLTSGILWGTNVGTGLLYAFDASKVSTMLWNSGQAPNSRDALGSAVQKYARPVVANGKVYIATVNSLVVYDLVNTSMHGDLGGAVQGTVASKIRMVKAHILSIVFAQEGSFRVSILDMRGRTRVTLSGFSYGKRVEANLTNFHLTPGLYCAIVKVASGRSVSSVIVLE
jgi:outer membrane protein assembly factor BamB